jgi:AcrR family transcriptional regulator
MARPSKLTDAQWEAIGKRLLAGESAAKLSREFGVSKAAISVRFSKRNETIKSVANQIVETERALSFLNVSEQIAARSLADDLKAISEHLAGAARFGAATSHRLAGIAHNKVAEIDDAKPLDENSLTALKGIAVLTRMANDASEIGLNLLRANKDSNVDDGKVTIEGGLPD